MTQAQLLRRWTDALRFALVATACGLLIGGRPNAAIALGLISATAIVLRPARPSAVVESSFVTLLAIDAWLTCSGLMAQIAREDFAGHLILAIAVTPVLAAGIVQAAPWPPHSIRRVAGLAGLATIALAVGWEVVESGSDSLLGTNMSLSAADTRGDLVSGLIGAAAGAVLTAHALSRDMAH